jgi:hypothetical protein
MRVQQARHGEVSDQHYKAQNVESNPGDKGLAAPALPARKWRRFTAAVVRATA